MITYFHVKQDGKYITKTPPESEHDLSSSKRDAILLNSEEHPIWYKADRSFEAGCTVHELPYLEQCRLNGIKPLTLF